MWFCNKMCGLQSVVMSEMNISVFAAVLVALARNKLATNQCVQGTNSILKTFMNKLM